MLVKKENVSDRSYYVIGLLLPLPSGYAFPSRCLKPRTALTPTHTLCPAVHIYDNVLHTVINVIKVMNSSFLAFSF